MLVMRGRMVDAAAPDAVLDDKPSERTAPDGQPPTNYAQAKLADMVFRAKLRRLEFDTRQGKLIEAALVKERAVGSRRVHPNERRSFFSPIGRIGYKSAGRNPSYEDNSFEDSVLNGDNRPRCG